MEAYTQDLSIRVFLVEDSRLIRQRLVGMLGRIPGIKVVGEAEDAVAAIDAICATKPDAVVLDLQLKSSSGLEVSRAIGTRLPAIQFIVLTNHATAEHRERCLAAGARHFLDKTDEFGRLRGILEQMKPRPIHRSLPCTPAH